MAATNFTPIILYHTTTASAAPTAGNLNNGELAININDGKLFYKDSGGTVQVIATKGTGTIGGSNTQVQYNSSGALAGSANFTFNGTTATINTLNLTNALGTAYGGTALTTYTQGDLVYASAANTLAKLGIGANTYILTSTGSVPQWSAPSAVTVSTANNLAGGAAGSVPYQSGAGVTTFLSIGTQNQVLTSSGTAPQWSSGLTLTTLVTTGNTTLGDAAADNLTVNATITSNLIFTDNTYDIGASGATRPRNLYIAGNEVVGGTVTWSGGVANTVPFLNASKVVTTSSGGGGLTWDGQLFGFGTTSSWGNNWYGLQILNGTSYVRSSGNSSHLLNNVYNDNANWRYIGNAAAAQIILGDGSMTFSLANTGSSGNVATFSTGVYIDQLGKGIGLFGTGVAIPSGMAAMLALGDNDTGLAWQQDGVIHTYVNNVQTITYYSGSTIFNQNAGFGRSPSYIVDIAGNSRIMGATAFQDNILRMSLPSGTSGNVNQILFRDQGDTNTTASLTAYGSAYGSALNNAVRIGNANGAVYLGQAGGWGLNTVPSTDWSTPYFIQADQGSFVGSADATRVQQNAYFSGALGGGAARLNATYAPSQYLQNGGNHVFYASGTGAAGSAITWNQQGILSNFGWNVGTRASLNWDSASIKAVQIGFDSATPGSIYETQSGVLGVANNYYYNGGDLRAAAGYSTRYYQYDGEHFFQVAATSSAGSGITWTNGMTINRNGTLLATGDSASDGSIKGFQTGNGFVERDYNYSSGSSRTITVAGTYNYKIEITVMAVGNSAANQIGEGRWIAGRRDYSGANHIYNSENLVGSCVSFSTSQSTVGAQCTYTITVTNSNDGANNHWVVKVRLINTDSFSIS